MEHGTNEHAEEQSHTDVTVKTEMEETRKPVEYIEVKLDCCKEELELGQEISLPVKEEILDYSLKGSLTPLMEQPGTCSGLHTFRLKIHKARLESVCRVQLRRLDIFPCEVCDAVYTDAQTLLQHVQEVHESGLQRLLHRHVKSLRRSNRRQQCAAGSSPAVYTCDYCQKMYPRKGTLVRHIESVHGKVLHRCSECKVALKSRRYLQKHIKMVHSKEEHKCEFCKKIFRTKQYYNTHVLRIHRRKSIGTSEHSENHHQPTCFRKNFTLRKLKWNCQQHEQSMSSNFGQDFKLRKLKWNCQQHEGCGQYTDATVDDLSAVASTSTQQHIEVIVKEEPADRDLELGPVMFQHMDCNYRPYKEEP